MQFNFDKLTLGEVATIEDLSGLSLNDIATATAPKGKALAAIVMVIKRRTGHPGFKFNDALAIPAAEAMELINGHNKTDDPEDEESDTDSGEGFVSLSGEEIVSAPNETE